jgi:4-amino-4-deoxy-L-arabinose transferase-like glycosyltransferase
LSATATARGAPARSTSKWRAERWTLVALTALALLLRVTNLSRSLFTDEAYSLALAQRSFGHMLVLFGYESNGTPYPIALWPLIRIFGSGPALLRAPAVLAGTLSVPALWWAAQRFVSRPAALLAAGLLAINPMAIWYSAMARQYAFVVLAACLAFGALPRALDGRAGRRAWVGYVAAMVALAYCDLLAAPIALPAQALIARGSRAGFRGWLRALAAVAACCVPLLVASAIARSRRNALYWLPKTDRALFTLALQEFTGGFSGLSAVRWATLAAGAALVGGALWSARRAADAERQRTLAIAACWGIAPGALLLAISFVEPVFWPRYAILALPGLCLLIAAAAERLWSRRGAEAAAEQPSSHRTRMVAAQLWSGRRGRVLAGGCVAILAIAGVVADAKQRTYLQEDWLPAAAWLRAARAAGQPVIVDDALVLPSLGYYDPAFRAANGDLIVQEWHDLPLPRGVVGFKDRTGYGSVPDGPPSAATLGELARRGGGTAWMVVSEVDDDLQSDPREGAAVAWARAHCRVRVLEGVGVWVMRAGDCRTRDPTRLTMPSTTKPDLHRAQACAAVFTRLTMPSTTKPDLHRARACAAVFTFGNGGGEIRTLGTPIDAQRLSRAPHSTALPPLRDDQLKASRSDAGEPIQPLRRRERPPRWGSREAGCDGDGRRVGE